MSLIRPVARVLVTAMVVLVMHERADAQSANCNLAPNAAFEQGTGTAITNWSYAQLSGSATFAISSYPSPVQSGSRAARIQVAQSGDLFLHTAEPGGIPVLPGTAYRLSARIKSDPGRLAALRVIEWNGTNVTADRFIGANTGAGDWETAEGTFTTASNTTTLSVRLMHHFSGAQGTGTFYWDDVLLARDCGKLCSSDCGQSCVDARHYVTQTTAGFKMCLDTGGSFCIDGVKTPNKEYLRGTTPGDLDYVSHTLASRASIGVQKSLGSSEWRCFANPDEECGAARTSPGQNAQFPPQTISMSMNLPVLSGPPASDRVTSGAALLHDWQVFGVRAFNPMTSQSGGLIGEIFHRTWAYILKTYNFGGSLGNQADVLVLEGESGGGPCLSGFAGGVRLERYMFVRGFGVVYAEGRDDTDCNSATTCDGIYATPNPGPPALFVHRIGADLSIANDAPQSFNVVDWW